jgi:DNA-binding transcriptional MerR regulator
MVIFFQISKGLTVALLDNDKDVLPLSSIAELLSAKARTLKMYEDKNLLPAKEVEKSKKLYSINDVKVITFVHYLASVKKINANGIKYILDMLNNNMDEKNRNEFLDLVENTIEKLSAVDVKEVEEM